ncbi:hypothetical protein DOJK_00915 [Patescibacteria group bacterium]|nr:hypothetical protein DOJK_00915 [Patescibacteria group bacterium]
MIKPSKFHITVATITLVSWGLATLIMDDGQRSSKKAQGAEYFSKGYTKWQMDEQGQLKNKLIAEKVTHYDDDTTHTVKPIMFFYNDRTAPWVVRSETGVLAADGNHLLLQGKALITRNKDENAKEAIINTSNLRVTIDTSYAETDEWAELQSSPNITSGTGMKMVFVEPIHIELLANVKGKYETN